MPTSRREKANVVEGLDVSPPLRPLASALLELVRALRRTSRRPSRLVRSYRPTGASLFLSSENMPQARFLPDHKATKPAKVVAPSIGQPNPQRGSHPIVWPMPRMAITKRQRPVNRQSVRPPLRELKLQ